MEQTTTPGRIIKSYQLQLVAFQQVDIPRGAQIINCEMERSIFCTLLLFVLADPDQTETQTVTIEIFHNNQVVQDWSPSIQRQFLRTLQERAKILHVFQRLN
jgi:hypothetical protein